MVSVNLKGVMKAVMMNKLHYLHMEEGDPEVTAELEVHPEVIPLALDDEAMAEDEAVAEGKVVVEDEEQDQLLHQQYHQLPLEQKITLRQYLITGTKGSLTLVLNVYYKTPGSIVPIPNGTTLFSRFFTDEVWELLVTETNRYAHAHPSIKPTPRGYDDVDVNEMEAFVGILILMGILRLPRPEMYLSTQESHKFISTPSISTLLTKTRFFGFFMWTTMLSRQHLQQHHQINYSK